MWIFTIRDNSYDLTIPIFSKKKKQTKKQKKKKKNETSL